MTTLFFIKNNKEKANQPTTEAASLADTIQVISLKAGDIKEIEIADSSSSLIYIPSGDKWSLQDHNEIPIDGEKLNYNCERLLEIKASRQIDATDLQDFGLSTPTQTVTYTLKDGKTVQLLVGTRTPDTANSYVKLNTSDSPIYLISSLISNSFVSQINELRNTQLEQYDAANVTGLTVEGTATTPMSITLSKEKNNLMTNYVLSTDTLHEAAVDGNVFKELAEQLPTLEVTDFIADGVTDLSSYGLDQPRLHLIIEVTETDATTKEASTRTLDYIFGDSLDDGKIAFMRTGDKSIYAMKDSFLDPLLEKLDPFKLCYKWIALMPINIVQSIDLHLLEGDYHLDINNDTYTINDQTVTEEAFKAIYTTLIDIKADYLVTEQSIGVNDTPEVYFVYTLKDGSSKPVNFYHYNGQFLLGTLNEAMTVNCSLKQFNYLEELITKTLSNLK